LDPELAKLFNIIQKENPDKIPLHRGDDLTMKSVAPYGIPSGIPTLDLYIGAAGGYPAGKIIEFYGKPMCGKTTAAFKAAAEWQKRGGGVLFIDAEHTFEQKHAKNCGVDIENLMIAQVETVEEIFDTIHNTLDMLKKTKWDKPFLVIVDSTTSVPTLSDLEGSLEDNDRPGYEAKQIKRGVRKCNGLIADLNASVIFINHSMAKIVSFGKKTDSGGGMGIKFYASVRVEFTSMGMLKKGDEMYGQKIKINMEKLKGAPLAFPKFDVELHFDKGFDSVGALFDAMVATNFAKKPKGSRAYILLPDTAYETSVTATDKHEWVASHGGYDKIYMAWRKWAIKEGYLKVWGGKC